MIYCIMMFYVITERMLSQCFFYFVSFIVSNNCTHFTHNHSRKTSWHTVLTVYTVSLVLGVPTVHRQKQSYLVNTLQSLLYDLSTAERKDIVIVVFVAEVTIYLCSLFLYISPGFICFIAFVRLHQTLWLIISSFLNSFLSSHFILWVVKSVWFCTSDFDGVVYTEKFLLPHFCSHVFM